MTKIAGSSASITVALLSLTTVSSAQALTFSNGPLVTSTGTGAGGADESVLQNSSLGMSTLGFGFQSSANNRVADDFTIPVGEVWNISDIVTYGYQTGSTTTSTFTSVNLQIWDGTPGVVGSNIVFGDTTTNRLISSNFSNIYRVTETISGVNNRPIMANTLGINVSLDAGTYWLDYQANGTLGSGPWAPPITILGQTTTGNGLQSVGGGAYNPALDSGTSTQQGFPFEINYTLSSKVPEPTATLSLLFLGTLGGASTLKRKLKRSEKERTAKEG